MRARAGRAASAPGAIARISPRIDILVLFNVASASRRMVNEPLPGGRLTVSLAEAWALTQVRDFATEMSARLTILMSVVVASAAAPALAQPCQTAITEFRFVINTETSMGHVKQDRQAAAFAELGRIAQLCSAGRGAEAMAALQALQRRMGFR